MTFAFSNIHKDMEKMTPGITDQIKGFMHTLVNPPELCGQTCVYLATGKAKELRGRYINADRDIESVVNQADIVKKANLYDMGIRELGEVGQGDIASETTESRDDK